MTRKLGVGFICGVLVLGAAALLSSTSAGYGAQGTQPPKKDPPSEIPAHHTAAPAAPLGDTLDPAQFSDAITRNAYAMAGKIMNVLYQQPCYCYCDRSAAHHSLYDCYTSAHATTCNICKMEAIFAYEQTRKGITATAIRRAIVRGDWRNIDPRDYSTPKDVR